MTSINFESVSFLKDTTTSFFTENAMDLEAIFFDEATREINFVSEGSINSNKSPSVFSIDENGKLVIAKGKNASYDSKIATDRVLRALSEKKVTNTIGKDIDVGCDTICVHSDTPNAVEIIKGIKLALNK